MTKLNNRLLTIFLSLGILFFIVVIYMFVTNEIIPKGSSLTKHSVNINNIKFIKNDYFDTAFIRKLQSVSEMSNEYNRESCAFSIINLADSAIYNTSGSFNLKTIISPQTIEFYNNSSIPQTTLKDRYKIVITCNKKDIVEFPVEIFYDLLDIKSKNDNSTEKKEIKLASTDKKVTIFVTFTVD